MIFCNDQINENVEDWDLSGDEFQSIFNGLVPFNEFVGTDDNLATTELRDVKDIAN